MAFCGLDLNVFIIVRPGLKTFNQGNKNNQSISYNHILHTH